MFKRKPTRSDYFLIAANLLPVIGAWFFGWNATEIFMVYCLETIIIGLFNVLKMLTVTFARKSDTWYSEGKAQRVSGLVFILFFIVHYGIFVAIQTGMFVAVSGIGKTFHTGFFDFFINWPKYIGKDAIIMMIGFVISYGFKFLWDFIRTGEYKTISMMKLMFQPYLRIFVQQFAVILGSIFLVFGAGKVFILIFACVKIYFEIFIDYESLLNKGIKQVEDEYKLRKE